MIKILDSEKLTTYYYVGSDGKPIMYYRTSDILKCPDLVMCSDCRKKSTMECPSRGLLENTIGRGRSKSFCSAGERKQEVPLGY